MSVSVIIPTFNRKELLIHTLNNILSQSMPPHEVIVVDDHSTDGTLEVVKPQFQNWVIFMSNKGKGPGAARNTGLSVATGDFIKFFDSDDLMTQNSLQVQYALLQNSDRQFIYSPYFKGEQNLSGEWLIHDPVIMHYYPFHEKKPLWQFMMQQSLFIAIPGMLFRRSLLEKVGPWREDATAYEDWDYLFRISLQEAHPLHTNVCAFLYRMHGAQITLADFSHGQRDADKVKVLEDIDTLISDDRRFAMMDKAFFRNMLYQLSESTPSSTIEAKLKKYDTVMNKVLWQYLRIRSRMGRAQTKTMWQPVHGPLVSSEVIKDYLNQL